MNFFTVEFTAVIVVVDLDAEPASVRESFVDERGDERGDEGDGFWHDLCAWAKVAP